MDALMALVGYLTTNLDAIILAVNGLVAALIAVFVLIPGDQPEKALRSVAEFIARFSRK